MKCITLYQPWATLVAFGHKTIETRLLVRRQKELRGRA